VRQRIDGSVDYAAVEAEKKAAERAATELSAMT
jgi:hypothetical protein